MSLLGLVGEESGDDSPDNPRDGHYARRQRSSESPTWEAVAFSSWHEAGDALGRCRLARPAMEPRPSSGSLSAGDGFAMAGAGRLIAGTGSSSRKPRPTILDRRLLGDGRSAGDAWRGTGCVCQETQTIVFRRCTGICLRRRFRHPRAQWRTALGNFTVGDAAGPRARLAVRLATPRACASGSPP